MYLKPGEALDPNEIGFTMDNGGMSEAWAVRRSIIRNIYQIPESLGTLSAPPRNI